MERLRGLGRYQIALLVCGAVMILVFSVLYPVCLLYTSYVIWHVGEKLFSNYIVSNMVEDSLGTRLFAEAKSVEDFYLQASVLQGNVV